MPDQETLDRLEADSLARYEKAMELVAQARGDWEALGKPLLVTGHNDVMYEHPALKVLREAEKDASARLKDIPKPAGTPGRKPTAVPSITASPASVKRRKLRAV